jgi:hypothetical protein
LVFLAIIVLLVTKYFLENFPLPCPLSPLVCLVSPPSEYDCKKPTPVREGEDEERGEIGLFISNKIIYNLNAS